MEPEKLRILLLLKGTHKLLTINDPISNAIAPAIKEIKISGFEAGPPRPEIGINVEKKNIVKYEKNRNGRR